MWSNQRRNEEEDDEDIGALIHRECQPRNREVAAAVVERESEEEERQELICIEASFNFNLLCCSSSYYLKW